MNRSLLIQCFLIAVARRIDKMREQFNSDDRNIELCEVDLANTNQRGIFIRDLIGRHQFIPYLINNAGIMTQGSLEELNIEDVRNAIELNALAPWELMKSLMPIMREHNFGRIVNITSGAPLNCFAGYGAYSSSKAMLNSWTVTAAREAEKFNIKINLMSPGRWLSRSTANRTCSSVTSVKSIPLGKYCRSSPLLFSFSPRSHGGRSSLF